MGKECGTWVSRRLWGGGNTSPLKTTAWEATLTLDHPTQIHWGIQSVKSMINGNPYQSISID